jgi:integrase
MLNWIQRNPFDKIRKLKEPPGLAPMFTDQQIRDLLMWCDRSKSPHLSLYARMILGTGARKQEILRATWGQISFRRKTMTFTKTKSKRQRTVPLPTALVELLRYHYDHRFGEDAGLMNFPEQEYLFPSARDPRKPAVNIHAAWNRARRRAGLPEFRIHSGRHHYASRLITDGQADILAVSILLGHSDVKQTARYAHLSQSHLISVVEKMAEHIVM